jgi:hypothetical protein
LYGFKKKKDLFGRPMVQIYNYANEHSTQGMFMSLQRIFIVVC